MQSMYHFCDSEPEILTREEVGGAGVGALAGAEIEEEGLGGLGTGEVGGHCCVAGSGDGDGFCADEIVLQIVGCIPNADDAWTFVLYLA